MSRAAGRLAQAGTTRDVMRARRRQAVIDVGTELVATQGHAALTMQGIAERLECGIASIYRVFPSRDALLAELQTRALARLHESWVAGLADLEQDLDEAALDEATTALARAVTATWFWVVAEDQHPAEIQLTRRLFIDDTIVVPTEQAASIVPGALLLLNQARTLIDDAAGAGAIGPGNGVERAVLLIASVTGVVQTAKFGRWDTDFFDPRRLAEVTIRDFFTAWGAAPSGLHDAFVIATGLASAGRLAPRVAPEAPAPGSAADADRSGRRR